MGAILFITFISIPIIEIALFIEVGNRIGFLATIGIVILTAITGTILIRHQGLATFKKARVSLKENILPINEVFDGLCIVLAGALLLTPGFFTDTLGLSLFVPSLRLIIKQYISKVLQKSDRFSYQQSHNSSNLKETTGSVIEGEFEDITDNQADRADKNKSTF
tara:strand:- start:309 stop:800 length:492 start_codon:yes stop_codon:yes gene_type:complete